MVSSTAVAATIVPRVQTAAFSDRAQAVAYAYQHGLV